MTLFKSFKNLVRKTDKTAPIKTEVHKKTTVKLHWLNEMTNEHRTEFRTDVKAGKSTKFIIRKLNDWGYWEELSQSSAKKRIERYWKFLRKEAFDNGDYLQKRRVSRRVNAFEELDGLIARQKKRVEKFKKLELKTNLPMKSVSDEMKFLADLMERRDRMELSRATKEKTGSIEQDPHNPNQFNFTSKERLTSQLEDIERELGIDP